jgi:hypothetical protein
MEITITGKRGAQEFFKETYTLFYGIFPKKVDLDLTDVTTLEISIKIDRKQNNSNDSDFTVLFGDAYLVPVS